MSDYIHQLYKLQPSFGQRYTQQHFLSHQYGDGFQAEIKTPCKRKCKLCKIPKQLSSDHKPRPSTQLRTGKRIHFHHMHDQELYHAQHPKGLKMYTLTFGKGRTKVILFY